MRNRWFKGELGGILNNHIVDYPTPSNISYMWGLGSLAGLSLGIQIISGILLSMHYTPNIETALASIEHIMREVNNGWLLRYIHSNGASMFFGVVYIHIGRGIYYGSYNKPREAVWNSGVILFLGMMATGFIGYVLPWGQMSFWGATVITNMVSAVPFGVGRIMVEWLWGGYSIDNPTLMRFYSIHYMLPFGLAGLAIGHIIILHVEGSSNPLGVDNKVDNIGFYPYCYVKDLFVFLVMGTILSYLVFYNPNLLGHPDNNVPANSIKTPDHIVPEWYFLPFYAILRAITGKATGIVAMGLAVLLLAVLPYVNTSNIRSSRFRPVMKIGFWIFAADVVLLGWLGSQLMEYPYQELSKACGVVYYLFILVGIPVIGKVEMWCNKDLNVRS